MIGESNQLLPSIYFIAPISGYAARVICYLTLEIAVKCRAKAISVWRCDLFYSLDSSMHYLRARVLLRLVLSICTCTIVFNKNDNS